MENVSLIALKLGHDVLILVLKVADNTLLIWIRLAESVEAYLLETSQHIEGGQLVVSLFYLPLDIYVDNDHSNYKKQKDLEQSNDNEQKHNRHKS